MKYLALHMARVIPHPNRSYFCERLTKGRNLKGSGFPIFSAFASPPFPSGDKGEKLGPITKRKSRDMTSSRRQLTRRDENRDTVHRHNFASAKNIFLRFFRRFFKPRPKIFFEPCSRRSSRRDRLVTGPRWNALLRKSLLTVFLRMTTLVQ